MDLELYKKNIKEIEDKLLAWACPHGSYGYSVTWASFYTGSVCFGVKHYDGVMSSLTYKMPIELLSNATTTEIAAASIEATALENKKQKEARQRFEELKDSILGSEIYRELVAEGFKIGINISLKEEPPYYFVNS